MPSKANRPRDLWNQPQGWRNAQELRRLFVTELGSAERLAFASPTSTTGSPEDDRA